MSIDAGYVFLNFGFICVSLLCFAGSGLTPYQTQLLALTVEV